LQFFQRTAETAAIRVVAMSVPVTTARVTAKIVREIAGHMIANP
jgi:hypothetical protein